MQSIVEALDSAPILRNLTPEQRGQLARYMDLADYAAGDTVVHEGEVDRAMFFCAEGGANMQRGEVDVGHIGAGDHFGELSMVLATPRAASVTAATRLSLARLTRPAFERLGSEAPGLARSLLEALIDGLAHRLTTMTDNVGVLLRERSLPRSPSIPVQVAGETRSAKPGTTLVTLLPRRWQGEPVVAALVDRKATSLSSAVSAGCDIEPLTTRHWEGQRIYRHSLALLLLEACRRVDPELELQIEHSMGFAQRVRTNGRDTAVDDKLANRIQEQMLLLAAAATPLREELWTVEEAREHFKERRWNDVADLLTTWRDPAVPLVSFGDVHALSMGPLVPNASIFHNFEVRRDDGGLLLMYGKEAASRPEPRATLTPPPPHESESGRVEREARAISRQTSVMTETQEPWQQALGVTSVGTFNRACIQGDVSQFIRVNEGYHEKRLGLIADEITDRGDKAKIVTIAGPSSSGKTTFIERLRVQLHVNGLNPVVISLDDYYVDREKTPTDADGQYDYEALDALHLDLLHDHIDRLLRGEKVKTARYDFTTGRSHPQGGTEVQLGDSDILMLEGLHGLGTDIMRPESWRNAFTIFVCPLAQLPFDRLTRVHASDLRLLRRIVRDRHNRDIDAEANILRWPSVRRGERRYIFPNQHRADAVFDSSLIYEISVLKVFAERYLLEVPQDSPAYTTAFRLLQLVDRFVTIYPDHVPQTSILREFIGGSGFDF